MKCFTASFGTETNTFSPMLTSKQNFLEDFYAGPGRHPDRPTLCTGPLWAARQRVKSKGWTVVEGSCSFAQPAGMLVRRDYEELRDEILEQLKAALPVDIEREGARGVPSDTHGPFDGFRLAAPP